MHSSSRRQGIGLVGALTLFVLFAPGIAFAASSPFRSDHGEPLNSLRLTPGSALNVGAATICVPGYSSRVRDVPESVKLAVYAEYGIASHPTGKYEIDHLIPLELGGSNAMSNLWPEFNDHPAGYLNSKDFLEDKLHQLVCSGVLPLGAAQRAIATDWVVAYHRYVGAWPVVATSTTTSTAAVAKPTGGPVSISLLLSPISPGSYELLKARTPRAGDACSLSVTLPSGATSQSNGLGPTTATPSGQLVWTWLIGTRTGPGTATAFVTCTAGSISKTFIIS